MPRVNLLYDVQPTVLTLCKQGANRKRIFLMKEQEAETPDLVALPGGSRILKNADWTYFYCVVAEPDNLEDAGVGDGRGTGVDDVWKDAEEIRKAAHFFAKSDRLVTGLHGTVEPYGNVIESAIALEDFTVTDPTGTAQRIKKGSWYVGIEPSEAGKIAIDTGEFTGISLEGTGFRQEVDLMKESDEKMGLLRKMAAALGVPLRTDSGSLNPDDPQEDEEVPDTDKLDALTGEVQDIKKANSALTTAVEGLVGTVNDLVSRLDKKPVPEKNDDEPTKADLKKAIDDLADTVAAKLDELDEQMDQIADPGSTQSDKADLAKAKSDNPLAGIL